MKRSHVLVFGILTTASASYVLLDRWAQQEIARRQVLEESLVEGRADDSFGQGFHELSVGANDWQSPHREDEIYWVLRGRALIRLEGRDVPVQEGSVIYVKAGMKHYFHQITEDLAAMTFTPQAPS